MSRERRPSPGVDQIYALIQRARERGEHDRAECRRRPGTLPAGSTSALYRILEEALASADAEPQPQSASP